MPPGGSANANPKLCRHPRNFGSLDSYLLAAWVELRNSEYYVSGGMFSRRVLQRSRSLVPKVHQEGTTDKHRWKPHSHRKYLGLWASNFFVVRTPPIKGKGNCFLERNKIMFAQVKGSFCFATRSTPQKRWKGFTNIPRMSWCGFANSASAVQSSLWDFGCPAFQIGKFHKSDLVLHYCHHHHGLSIKYNTQGPSA